MLGAVKTSPRDKLEVVQTGPHLKQALRVAICRAYSAGAANDDASEGQ